MSSLRDFSLQLDRICSIIFSFSSLIVLSLVSTTIFVGVVFALSMLAKWLLPEYYTSNYTSIILYSIAAFFIFFAMVSSLFNYTKLKHTKFAEKVHFPIYWFFSSLFFNILNRPFHYISLTFATNTRMTLVSFFISIYMFFLFGFFVLKTVNNRIGFETRSFYATHTNAFALSTHYYDNLRSEKQYIRFPSLSSDIIGGSYVKLFIPYQKPLDEKLEQICANTSLEEKKDSVSIGEFEHDRLSTQRHLQCFQSLYSVRLNDKLLEEVEWQFYVHPNKGEKGIIHYLPTDSLPMGKNVLHITRLPLEESEEAKQWEIPFWK